MKKNGEMLYDVCLRKIMKTYQIPGVTNNKEVDSVGYSLFGTKFNGTVPFDRYDRKKEGYWVVNTHVSGMPGEHWFGIVVEKGQNPLVYDSFGRKLINAKGFEDTEQDAEQDVEEENCGARTLAFLLAYDIGGRNLAKQI